jgi:RecA-family ATPase
MKAARENPSAPPDYSDNSDSHPGKIKRAFERGVLDPKGPPSNAKVLPESQWFGDKPMDPPPALIRGVFPQTGVATIGGQSGSGKSFHAIHFSLCVIPNCDRNFYIDQYRIKREGGVLYFVLEGKASFPMRLTAAYNHMMDKQMEFGERLKIPFAWNTYSPSLFSEGPDALLKIIERDASKMRKEFGVDMVAFILDTMGLAAIYKKEDDAAQVQKVISDLGRMSEETGALAVNVDHYGKDQGPG